MRFVQTRIQIFYLTVAPGYTSYCIWGAALWILQNGRENFVPGALSLVSNEKKSNNGVNFFCKLLCTKVFFYVNNVTNQFLPSMELVEIFFVW